MAVPAVDLVQGLVDFADWVSIPYRMFTGGGRSVDFVIDGYSIYKSWDSGSDASWPKSFGMTSGIIMERILKPVGAGFAGGAAATWGKLSELAAEGALEASKRHEKPPGRGK